MSQDKTVFGELLWEGDLSQTWEWWLIGTLEIRGQPFQTLNLLTLDLRLFRIQNYEKQNSIALLETSVLSTVQRNTQSESNLARQLPFVKSMSHNTNWTHKHILRATVVQGLASDFLFLFVTQGLKTIHMGLWGGSAGKVYFPPSLSLSCCLHDGRKEMIFPSFLPSFLPVFFSVHWCTLPACMRVLDPLELELQIVVSCHVSARTWIQVL